MSERNYSKRKKSKTTPLARNTTPATIPDNHDTNWIERPSPQLITPQNVMQFQRTIGNRATLELLRIQRAPATSAFSDDEAKKISKSWKDSGSYTTKDTGKVEKSIAYYKWYQNAKKAIAIIKKKKGKATAKTVQDGLDSWDDFIKQQAENPKLQGPPPPIPDELTATKVGKSTLGPPPTNTYEHQKSYDVTMPDGKTKYNFTDQPMSPSYKYYMNTTGVMKAGKKINKHANIDDIFKQAGITDKTIIKVMKKVSAEEGGFEAVNTYDTGYISVGFIQFTSKKTGKGSLADVLTRMKTKAKADFDKFFHDKGIDVSGGEIVIVDPETGNVLSGEDAVKKVIEDKRLTATFHEAGLNSDAFKAAQIYEAYQSYYLADKSISDKIEVFKVTDTSGATPKITYYYDAEGKSKKKEINSKAKAAKGATKLAIEELDAISGKYQDVLQSEAGKTAFMDRAVQRGSGNAKSTFHKAAIEILKKEQITTAKELAKHEKKIVEKLKNRIDVLSASDLTQPK